MEQKVTPDVLMVLEQWLGEVRTPPAVSRWEMIDTPTLMVLFMIKTELSKKELPDGTENWYQNYFKSLNLAESWRIN